MNRRNSIALLAGSALVAIAATGCSSNAAKPTASGPAAGTSASSGSPGGTPSSGTAPASDSAPAPAGGTSSAPNAGAPSSAPAGNVTTAPAAAPVSHPVCANADLNASLASAVSGQKSSVAVIAVKNAGPTCTTKPIPYVWISAGPGNGPEQTRPLIPSTDPSKQLTILSGTTIYAAIDLNPNSAGNAVAGYTFLDVTANPTRDTSGKDVQDLKLPAPAGVAGAMLSVYADTPSLAISQIQYATTAEQ